MSDKIIIDYNPITEYNIEALNSIGANNSLTLRSVTTHNENNCRYVKKYGIPLTGITSISTSGTDFDIDELPAGNSLKIRIVSDDINLDTDSKEHGYIVMNVFGGVIPTDYNTNVIETFQIDSYSSTGIIILLENFGGAEIFDIVGNSVLTLNTNLGVLTFTLPKETMQLDNIEIPIYAGINGSVYYDQDLKNEGIRVAADGTPTNPYLKIQDGLNACDSYFPICTVLDSETYDEELIIDGAWTLQAALGQSPQKINGIGSRESRELYYTGSNEDTIYVSDLNGSDDGYGTYQSPYQTIEFAVANIGTKNYIKIMDSETYIITQGLFIHDINIEPLYGQTPKIESPLTSNLGIMFYSSSFPNIYLNSGSICGFNINGRNRCTSGIYPDGGFYVHDNTVYNFISNGIYNDLITTQTGEIYDIQKNIVYNCNIGINSFWHIDNIDTLIYIKNNKCYNCTDGIKFLAQGGGTNNAIVDILNNISYNNSDNGVFLTFNTNSGITANINNNTCVYNNNGIDIIANPLSLTIKNNILYFNTTYDIIKSSGAGTITLTYSCFSTNSGIGSGAGNTSSDPLFINSTIFNYALKITSPAYKTGENEVDMGAYFGGTLISASDVTINGFFLENNNIYNYGIYKNGASDYNNTIIKWCTINDYNSNAIDDYSGLDTNTSILNCIIYNNGNGINCHKGINSVNYCIIYNNKIYGLYQNGIIISCNHNIFFANNITGHYLTASASEPGIKNSVYYANAEYGINSVINITINNCCINDFISSTVEYLTASLNNITDNPLLVNENSGEEDFHIKLISRGYLFNSPCRNEADDGYSIGSYLENETITDQGWKSYQIEHEPTNLNIENITKNVNRGDNNFGDIFIRGRNYKMILPFEWSPTQATTDKQSKKIKYFQSLIPTVKNELTKEECLFRIWFLPENHFSIGLGNGTNNSSDFSITDNTKDWVENEWKGFHVAVQFEELATGSIDSTTKEVTQFGASWTTNQWAGFYYRVNLKTYIILSNSTNKLQLSDPYDYLTTEITQGFIEDYYKIISNIENKLVIFDTYSTFITGTYSYYIAFINAYVSSTSYRYTQPNYNISNGEWKSGYSITFEEE